MDNPSQQTPLSASAIDPKLMAHVLKGDQRAFSQLYDQSSSLLFSMAVRILGSREEAVELLQEVYFEIWRKVVRYDAGRGTPIAWLITLTRSRAIDRLRARRQTGGPLDSAPASHVEDRHPSPLDSHADRDLRSLVSGALADLPQPQQQAIELAYYEGLSHAEIAARLNQPLDTVKTRIKLGMSKLHDALRHHEDQTGQL
jgi:RNA polymerase sigma-70 factor (ECF subfamily)